MYNNDIMKVLKDFYDEVLHAKKPKPDREYDHSQSTIFLEGTIRERAAILKKIKDKIEQLKQSTTVSYK